MSYLLTTKLFCGKCGTLMGGESGTSHMGNTYYYYKCGNAKRHGKAHCDLKAIRKEPLERFVVETAIKVIFSDEIIERLIDLIMEAQQQENTRLPVLKDQLRDTEKRLANLLEAIEQGILTPTTKQRLDELEARKEALNTSILEEELKKPVLTREWMRFWFEKFRKGDMRDMEHQRAQGRPFLGQRRGQLAQSAGALYRSGQEPHPGDEEPGGRLPAPDPKQRTAADGTF